ncbi:lysophospholipid acyltransferase family protein [Parvibium lacunae]|uniref:Lysophospholipid acyltransferase family protein n=1 Tax=Parvibium lacunae TaxID=1888893 RepID=A0A368L4W1_9BURK|nr:lysophospholipid acyltransferase family protein [Parvibium lacunae]
MLGAWRLLGCLPLRTLHMLGGLGGQLATWFSAALTARIQANLGQAGLLAHTTPKQVLRELGKGALELAAVWFRPPLTRAVEVRGWEHAQAAAQAGKGILYLTPHLGCFEITARWLGTQAPITVMYRPPRKAWLRPLAEDARGTAAVKLASADLSGVRKLVRALKNGETIGLLPDQVPGNGEGVWVPFFGRPAYTMTLPARLHELTDATILLTWGERLPKGRGYIMHIEPLPAPLQGSLEEQTAQINAAMEMLIRRCPSQYLWTYNRYKTPKGAPPASGANSTDEAKDTHEAKA